MNPATTQTRKRAEQKERMGLSEESRMHSHSCRPPTILSLPLFFSALLRDAQQGSVDEKASSQQLSSPINPVVLLSTCASGVISTCGTKLLLYLMRCVSPLGIRPFIKALTQPLMQTPIPGSRAKAASGKPPDARMVQACHDDAVGQPNLLRRL